MQTFYTMCVYIDNALFLLQLQSILEQVINTFLRKFALATVSIEPCQKESLS